MSKSAASFFSPSNPVTDYQDSSAAITVLAANGEKLVMDLAAIDQVIHWACGDVTDVKPELLIARCRNALHNGMKANEVDAALVATALSLAGTEPAYSQVSARLLLDSLWNEVRIVLGQQTAHGGDYRSTEYPALFRTSINAAVELGLLPEGLLTFDLDRLSRALRPERDKWFTYPGLLKLSERHLLQVRGRRLELPQSCFMRMAMEFALSEADRDSRAIEYYAQLSGSDYADSGRPG